MSSGADLPGGLTLFDKLWNSHVIADLGEGTALLHVDRHLVHDLGGPPAYAELERRGLPVRSPELSFATPDHVVSSAPDRTGSPLAWADEMITSLREGSRRHAIRLFDVGESGQGIVHVIGPELGLTLPGALVLCGDSHTTTHGALGALAWGIGASEINHVLATQTILQKRPKRMRITVEGELRAGVEAKDLILAIIARLGAAAGTGHAVEYAGPVIERMSMAQRMTLCNMSIEMGARSGLIAPDETTFAWLKGRRYAPKGAAWDRAVAAWRDLKSDADMQAQWTLYEEALAWAQGNRTRVASVNALGMGAALAAAPATPLLLVSGTMHIESSPLRWPDPDKLIAFFQRATAAGRVGNQATGMRWSIGADVGWLDGEARAAEVIRTLSALGVEWDVHVHSPADAAGAAQRIVALGGTPNTVLSGVKTADIERFRSAQPGTTGYSWQAQSLWGVVREGNHGPGSEDLSSGLWQPRSSSDWMAHDPSASGLAIVGGGSRDLAGAESLAARLTQGSYTAPVYSATVMVDQVTLTVSDAVNATTSSDGIEQIEAFANRLGVLPQVRWATLSGAAAAWRAAGSIPSRVTNTQ